MLLGFVVLILLNTSVSCGLMWYTFGCWMVFDCGSGILILVFWVCLVVVLICLCW